MAVRRNKADATRAVGHGVQARGAGAARRLAQRRERVARVDLRAQPVAASQRQGAIVLLNPAQRHLLDKGEIDAPGAGEFDQIQHLVVVAPAQDERIQAQARKARGGVRAEARGGIRAKARGNGRVDAGDDLFQMTASGELAKAPGAQAVEADVQAQNARRAQRRGEALELRAVGGDGEFIQPGQGA